MNYIFFGSPEFAAIILKKLIDAGFPPMAVVCNPDKPFGRKQVMTPPPVKRLLLESQNLKLETNAQPTPVILQPETLDSRFKLQVSSLKPDFFIVAAYAKIIPKDVLAIPRLGSIGVHPSLLPKYRGATPIQSVILSGEKETGTTLFMLDEKVDHGTMLASANMTIADEDSYESLLKKLAGLSGDLLAEILPKFIDGKMEPQTQNEAAATFTKKFGTDDGFVDFKKDAPEAIWRKIRALNPDPGVFTFVEKDGKKIRVKLLDAELLDGKLHLKTVQREGGRPVPADQLRLFAE